MIANLLSIGLGALAAKAVSTAMGNNSPQALQDMFASASVNSSLVRPANNLVHRIFNSNLKGRSGSVDLGSALDRITSKYDDLDVASTKMTILDMLQDPRFAGLRDDNANKTILDEIKVAMSGNLGSADTINRINQFKSIHQGVAGAGDIFMRKKQGYDSIAAQFSSKMTAANPIAALARYTNTPVELPKHVTALGKSNLTADELDRYQKFTSRLSNRTKGEFTHDAGRDIVEIKSKFKGVEYKHRYASFRIGNQSMMVPLQESSAYNVAGMGEVYFRDKSGSLMYGTPGKVLKYDKAGKSTLHHSGLSYLFEGDEAGIWDIVDKVHKEGSTLDQLLFSIDGSPTEGAIKLLEYVDTSDNPMNSLARKNAQVQVIDEARAAGVSGLNAYTEYEQELAKHGYASLAVGSPGQTADNKFFWTSLNPQKPGDTPSFMKMMGLEMRNGKLVIGSDLGKRPIRPGTEPFKILNRGSNAALANLAPDMHLWSKGAFGEMANNNMTPFLNATWYVTEKGKEAWSDVVPIKDAADSAGLTLDVRMPKNLSKDVASMTDSEIDNVFSELMDTSLLGTYKAQNASFDIIRGKGRDAKDYEAFAYNDQLTDFISEIENFDALDPEERQRRIAALTAKKEKALGAGASLWNEDDFLGMGKTADAMHPESLKVGGYGKIVLHDVVKTEEGFRLSFARHAALKEGSKIEGSTKSVLSRTMLAGGSSFNQQYRNAVQELVEDASFDPSAIKGMDKAKWAKLSANKRINSFVEETQRAKSPQNAAIHDLARRAKTKTLTNVRQEYLNLQKKFGMEGAAGTVDFIAESKNLLGGNTKELRTQQQTALHTLSGMSLKKINDYDLSKTAGTSVDPFLKAMEKHLGKDFTREDSVALAKYLRVSKQAAGAKAFSRAGMKSTSSALGAIFGLEQGGGGKQGALMKVIQKDRGALTALGLDDTFINELEQGITESKGVFGIAHHRVRDISSVSDSNDVKIERRFFDHVLHAIDDKELGGTARLILDTVANRVQKLDMNHHEAISRAVAAQANGPASGDLFLDLNAVNKTNKNTAMSTLDDIKKKGGFLKVEGRTTFLPGQDDLTRIVSVDDRAARKSEDLELKGLVSNILDSAKSKLARDDDDFSNIVTMQQKFAEGIFGKHLENFNSRLEGRMRGSSMGQIRQAVGKAQREELHGYTVGMSKADIDKHFDELIGGANSKDEIAYLKKWKKGVIEGTEGYAVLGWQNPQIGPESMSLFKAYYDRELDDVGGHTVGSMAEFDPQTRINKRVAGLLTGKTSSDFDGDKANFMVVGASSGRKDLDSFGAEVHWQSVKDLTSASAMKKQYNRQAQYYKDSYAFEGHIKASFQSIADAMPINISPTQAAFQKGAGQADVGRISNRVLDLHAMNYMMQETGAFDKAQGNKITSFLHALEQEAVGFKHGTLSPADFIEAQVGKILDMSKNSEHALTDFADVLSTLGFNDKTGGFDLKATLAELDIKDERKVRAMVGIEFVRQGYANVEANRKSEKVKPLQLLNSIYSGYKNIMSAAMDAEPEQAKSIMAAALNAVEDQGLRERIKNDIGERMSALNEASKTDAAGKSALGRDIVGGVEEAVGQKKATGLNKMARVLGIGGAVAAGAYALFNSGYDDTPLTDVPPPPPGRSALFATNADLESVRNGSLLNDAYGKQNQDMAGASQPTFESNIAGPSVLSKKSYLNGATARISNRSLIVDRTNPMEYARAIQATIPGAQVGVNMNYNYNIPSDIERAL
jgi:hypothetical protein